jgi:Zn-dependent protease/CBS domain-containing protein
MFSSFKIGKIAGIEIGVHWSWLFIFALITWSFASGILQEFFPDWSDAQRWSVGVIVAIIFFASILLHELSHSLVAKARGIPVKGITLFVFGGVSNLGREAQSAGEEFWIAIVGPLTSLAIGGAFTLLWAALLIPAPDAAAIAAYLAAVNAIIAAFNMLPGFPLDGGRVFRSIVWARNRNLLRATRTAARVGEYVAYLLMAAGALQILFGMFVGGVWMIFIAIFLRNASSGSYEQLLLEMALQGVSAGELARSDYDLVSPELTVAQLVDEHMLAGRGRCYPVMAGENLLGLITLTDVRRLEREKWPETSVFRAMTPFERLRTVAPQESAARVLQMMGESDLNQVPVVDGRRLAGIVTRGDILRLIQVRQAVGLSDQPASQSHVASLRNPGPTPKNPEPRT